MELRTSFKRADAPKDLIHLARTLDNAEISSEDSDFGQAVKRNYKPFWLTDRKIIMSDETLGAISQLEIQISRHDCLIGTSDLGPSLARVMARMDGIFVALLNGMRANYRLCCYLDFLQIWGAISPKGRFDPDKLSSLGLRSSESGTISASRCAQQMETIELNSLYGAAPDLITPSHVLSLQQAINHAFHPTMPSGFRSWDLEASDTPSDKQPPLDIAYQPPAPLELPAYLQDLVNFLNESPLGPIAKTSLAYYQLEATKMFPSGNDQLGRALLVGIWRNMGLIKYIMPPIAITPALAQRQHNDVLKPYQRRQGASEMLMVDEWVYHTACASRNALEVMQYGHTLSRQTLDRWRETLTKASVRLTSNIERFLVAIVGTPIFSTTTIAKTIGTTFTTSTKIISTLETHGIIRQISQGRRNKVYECPDAVDLFERIVPDMAS